MTGVQFVTMSRRVREHLDQAHRFAHTLRVARLCGRLAHAHREDRGSAYVAGMLHDLARLYPADRLLRECTERGMPIDTFERDNPIVLHARLGAELARDAFGIADEAVLSAIRKHTVGAAAMSPLDCIVYLADGLEPGRDYPEREALLGLAFRDLNAAMRALLGSTIEYLGGRNLRIAPQTLAAVKAFERPPISMEDRKTA